MIKLYFKASGLYVPTVIVDVECYSDLMAVIEDLYEQDRLPVPLYTEEEMEDLYPLPMTTEDVKDDWIPINGGEYWIEGLDRVEEL